MSALGSKLIVFTAAMLALLGALLYPAGLWGGTLSQAALGIAWSLAVIPGWLVLIAQRLVVTPQQKLYLTMAAMVGRLLFVGVGALFVITLRQLPELQFAVWVVVCYMAALLAETGLVLPRGAFHALSAPPELSPTPGLGGS